MKSRLTTWGLNALLVGIALAVALGITETAVRLLFPQPTGLSHHDRYGLAMHWPGLTRYLPQFGHEVSFNSAGMRDREHPVEKPAGTFRILLLGDSFMEALQVPFESTFASHLEQGLTRAAGRPVEVLNAGVSGWGTDDELRYLTQYGLKYHPDLVVVAMTLHNDISDNLRQDWHELQGDSLVERQAVPAPYVRYKIFEVKAYLSTRFQTYQLWRRVRHGGEMRQVANQLNSHIVQLFRQPEPEKIARGFELTRLLLTRLDQVARENGARTAVVLLPLRLQLSDSSFAVLARSANLTAADLAPLRPQQTVTSFADTLQIPVVDLLPRFRQWTAEGGAPLYLEQDGHWNEAGHRLAADVVVSGLVADSLIH